jgi:hypothetical protein
MLTMPNPYPLTIIPFDVVEFSISDPFQIRKTTYWRRSNNDEDMNLPRENDVKQWIPKKWCEANDPQTCGSVESGMM